MGGFSHFPPSPCPESPGISEWPDSPGMAGVARDSGDAGAVSKASEAGNSCAVGNASVACEAGKAGDAGIAGIAGVSGVARARLFTWTMNGAAETPETSTWLRRGTWYSAIFKVSSAALAGFIRPVSRIQPSRLGVRRGNIAANSARATAVALLGVPGLRPPVLGYPFGLPGLATAYISLLVGNSRDFRSRKMRIGLNNKSGARLVRIRWLFVDTRATM